jgi:hypothetical protein
MGIYELVIDNEETDEVFKISMVSSPAIEESWVFFNEDKVVKFAAVDEEKRLIVAPVLIPNKQIIRADGEGRPYYVFFKEDTIEQLAQNFLKKGYQWKANIEHETDIEGKIVVVESWVSKSMLKDKSAMYFNKPFPAGTWFITWKVLDDNLWNNFIKTGELTGASIEGMFEHVKVSASSQEYLSKSITDLTDKEAEQLLNKISYLLELQPSIPNSTYPGESATGSIAPALLAELPEMNIYGYETEYFYVCPGAVGTFNHLINEMNIVEDDLVDMIRAAAVFADKVFKIEADVIAKGKSTPQELERASVLVDMFKDVFQTIDERTGMKHDISYMDAHIEVIKGLL